MKKNFFLKKTPQGFILPFTMLISTLVLIVVGTATTLLSKQLYFSKLYKQSQTAYYASDDAITCAILIDDTYVGVDGMGLFPYDGAVDPAGYMDGVMVHVSTLKGSTILLTDIKCAQSALPNSATFAASSSPYTYHPSSGPDENGITTVYDMRMPLGDGQFRCAKVTIHKSASFRQVIAQGYSQCNFSNSVIERAVVNTTVSE